MEQYQRDFLVKIGINPESDTDLIEEQVGDYLITNCLDENYNPTADGLICESILDNISEQE